jgi:hypothetical protein
VVRTLELFSRRKRGLGRCDILLLLLGYGSWIVSNTQQSTLINLGGKLPSPAFEPINNAVWKMRLQSDGLDGT